MSLRNRSLSGRGERVLSQVVLVLGAGAAGGLWYVVSGVDPFEALLLPGLFSLAVVAVVVVFNRVRSRERWEAAWEAYAAQEWSPGSGGPHPEEGPFSLAGTP